MSGARLFDRAILGAGLGPVSPGLPGIVRARALARRGRLVGRVGIVAQEREWGNRESRADGVTGCAAAWRAGGTGARWAGIPSPI